ncbi:Asp-tRNAAsn/Glu-tRNAGln amidotransferase A subunit or related amidase [Geosmithia morbida]|uniref:Asp-tRNAAsn/Glu-tRNAGln amidotransferase A subunit or related amidase n=1 Tax=Geosmithia morbida TaxID=1094350 RepID=A0A9P4YPA7_9HYPO|nr:Asp-tRNAAsn/Glu-tRNAGln amidotransferase A subunit or related amidase [Geosmithia morbida]KAF4120638.1 Asp-tRNAAsn/Glu-tRNAGln amidotransferase A subunit or related amidase [Geosmithia morbida]
MVSLSTCLIAGIHYLIHPRKLGSITANIHPDAILPVTLLSTEEIFGGQLEQILDAYSRVDDVFIPEFGSVLIEKFTSNDSTTSTAVNRQHVSQKTYSLEEQTADDGGDDFVGHLPSGPYILHGPNLYQAWRLYEDQYEAFNFGVIPEDPMNIKQFIPLSSLSLNGLFKSIPVPSRLYSPTPSKEKPLSGQRFSIPDVMILKGVQTTVSSRAWTALYPPLIGKTASYAQKLIDLGAVIVGKTKISQFASGQQWVDVKAPWNPAGDGYQDPSGSSAGAAMAAAAYGWLETAVGEDSIGGLRSPGARAGVYSLRPSFLKASLDGVQTSSPRYDTIGLAASSLSQLRNATRAVLGNDGAAKTPPQSIVYLGDLDHQLPHDQLHLIRTFVGVLESFLDITAEKTTLEALWAKEPPHNAGLQSLKQFLNQAPLQCFYCDYAATYQDFLEDYRDRFHREPYVEATVRHLWSLGANVTQDEYRSSINRLDTFQTWFEETVMTAGPNTIIVFPYGVSQPKYRQSGGSGSSGTTGSLLPDLLASVLGAPHLIVPFGETPYLSEVSMTTEYLPVSASVLGARDSDKTLVQLVHDALEKAGKRTTMSKPQTPSIHREAPDVQRGLTASGPQHW